MRAINVLLIFISLSLHSVAQQDQDELKVNKWVLSIHYYPSVFSQLYCNCFTKAFIPLGIGGEIDYNFTDRVNFKTGLYVKYKQLRTKSSFSSFTYFEIPVNLKFNFIYFSFGNIYLTTGFSNNLEAGKIDLDWEDIDTPLKNTLDFFAMYNLGFGLTLNTSQLWVIKLEPGLGYAFTRNLKENVNRYIKIGISRNFCVKR
jgi:hypothetical protein